jgi:hypothetical protein
MASFAVTNSTITGQAGTSQTMTTTMKSVIACVVGTSNSVNAPSAGAVLITQARRGRLYDILIGTNTTPGDTVVQWDVARLTAFGSSIITNTGGLSSVSSNYALDVADYNVAATVVANSCAETNITAGAELWGVGINQRASYRWVAAPGSEMVWPATSCQGLDLRAMGPSGGGSFAGTVTATVMFTEL